LSSFVISHGDLDGITSGAIGLLAYPGATFYFTRPSQVAQDIYRIAKDMPETLLISDIAVNTMRFDDIMKAIDRLPKQTAVTWIDHHPLPARHKKKLESKINFIHEIGPCAAELVYRQYEKSLPEHAIRLALYGAIGDYADGTPFATSRLEDYDKRTLYLEAGLLVQALQEIDYRNESKDLVRDLSLGVQPSAMNDIVSHAIKATRIENEVFRFVQTHARKMGQVGYVLDMPISGYRGKAAKFTAYVTDSQIGISAKSSEDVVDMSLRTRRSNIDLNKALNTILPEIPDAKGGGHPKAAGASLPLNEFPTFLQQLAEYVDSH
jgi:RecJ-like exonuclease